MSIRRLLDLVEATNASVDLKRALSRRELDPHEWELFVRDWADEVDLAAEFIDDLTPEQVAEFTLWVKSNEARLTSENPREVPPTTHMTALNHVKPTEWLVHFTGFADDIASNGFSCGTEYNGMHLTTGHDTGPYAFAFVAGSRDAEFAARRCKYGKEAVMFKASGALETHHSGDEEHQVVFDKEHVSEVVPLYSNGRHSDWWVGESDHPFVIGDFDKVVHWVEQHYDQYRKAIVRLINR